MHQYPSVEVDTSGSTGSTGSQQGGLVAHGPGRLRRDKCAPRPATVAEDCPCSRGFLPATATGEGSETPKDRTRVCGLVVSVIRNFPTVLEGPLMMETSLDHISGM